LCLLFIRQRRFQYPWLVRLDFGQNLVFRYALEQHEQRRRSLRDCLTKLLDEIVANAEFHQRSRQRTGACSGHRAESHPSKGIPEEHAKQGPEKGTSHPSGRCTYCSEIYSLFDMNLAARIALDYAGIL